MAHVIEAAKRCEHLSAIYCSTDHVDIATEARSRGISVLDRPTHLGGDDISVLDVVQFHLKEINAERDDFLFLLQPTSPFLLPEVLTECINQVRAKPECDGIQTIADFPHNFHAFNQRFTEGEKVFFKFEKERMEFFNKQKKPSFFVFGNLIGTQVQTILEKGRIFPEHCLFRMIPRFQSLDVDGPDDFEYAEYLLKKKKVILPWLSL